VNPGPRCCRRPARSSRTRATADANVAGHREHAGVQRRQPVITISAGKVRFGFNSRLRRYQDAPTASVRHRRPARPRGARRGPDAMRLFIRGTRAYSRRLWEGNVNWPQTVLSAAAPPRLETDHPARFRHWLDHEHRTAPTRHGRCPTRWFLVTPRSPNEAGREVRQSASKGAGTQTVHQRKSRVVAVVSIRLIRWASAAKIWVFVCRRNRKRFRAKPNRAGDRPRWSVMAKDSG